MNDTFVGIVALLLAGLAVVPAAGAVDVVVTVPNSPPVVGTPILRSPDTLAIVTTRAPNAGTTTDLVVDVPVTDVNLVGDLTGVTVGITTTAGAEVWPQTAASTLSTPSTVMREYRATVSMHYWDPAAIYRIKVVASDTETSTTALVAATFTYGEAVGIKVPSDLDLGVAAGTAGTPSAMSIANWGNIQMDPRVSGAGDLDGPDTAVIGLGDVLYALDEDMTDPSPVTTTPTTVTAFDLARQTTSTEVPKDLWFQVDAPEGLPAGDYVGTLTVTAVDGR